MLNRHNLPMRGLRAASSATKGLNYCGGDYVQISYDRDDGAILAAYHVSLNNWTQYRSPSIITICNARGHLSMQRIADLIADNPATYEHY